jgi:hypothetical protein
VKEACGPSSQKLIPLSLRLFCTERQNGKFTEIYISALMQLGWAVLTSFAVKAWCSHLRKPYVSNVGKSSSFSFKA